MVKIRPVKFFATLGGIALASILILSLTTTDSEFGFEIPPPQLSVVKVGDTQVQLLEGNEIPSVACWTNMAVNILDEKGNIIGTEKSGFFKVNPTIGVTLSLTDVITGKELVGRGGFELVPQMKCTTVAIQFDQFGNIQFLDNAIDPNDPESELFPVKIGALQYPSFQQPITIETNDLVMKVYSQEKDSDFLRDTHNSILKIQQRDVKTGESFVLGKATIDAGRIAEFLQSGTYESKQYIVLEGAIPMHWTETEECGFSCYGVSYFVNLETQRTFEDGKLVSVSNPLMVTRDLKIDKESSGNSQDDNPDKPLECPSGQIRQGVGASAICAVSGTTTTTTTSTTQNIQIPIVGDIVNDIRVCLDSGNSGCFFTEKFIAIGFIGLGLLLILGAIIALATKRKEVYGVDIG